MSSSFLAILFVFSRPSHKRKTKSKETLEQSSEPVGPLAQTKVCVVVFRMETADRTSSHPWSFRSVCHSKTDFQKEDNSEIRQLEFVDASKEIKFIPVHVHVVRCAPNLLKLQL